MPKTLTFQLLALAACIAFAGGCQNKLEAENIAPAKAVVEKKIDTSGIDTAAYDKRIQDLHINDSLGKWTEKKPYPLKGAILPFKRVIAFYGNLFSKRM